MSAVSDVHVAHFVITGEALTRHARALMLEDEPGKAYRLLAQGLVGDGADEVVRKVLAGELDLNGDSRVGVGVEPGGDDAAKYVEDLRWLYAGRLKIDGRWYRPRAIVTSYGPKDVAD